MAHERLTRKEIKHDEFVSVMGRALRWIEDNHQKVLPSVGAVILIVVLAAGARTWWHSREQAALSALGEVEERYHATIEGEQQPVFQPSAAGLSYASRDEKYTAVLEAIEGLTEKYRTGPALMQALYYRGLALRELGRHDEATTVLKDLVDRRPTPLIRALARVALAETQEAAGRWSEAEGVYRSLFDEAPEFFPREVALLGRARCFERQDNLEEARALYRQLIDAYPGSPYEPEARQRLEQLG